MLNLSAHLFLYSMPRAVSAMLRLIMMPGGGGDGRMLTSLTSSAVWILVVGLCAARSGKDK